VFRTESTITDEDIDLILSRGEEKTEAMNEKLSKHVGMSNVLSFSADAYYKADGGDGDGEGGKDQQQRDADALATVASEKLLEGEIGFALPMIDAHTCKSMHTHTHTSPLTSSSLSFQPR
jgi:hypothetical protein